MKKNTFYISNEPGAFLQILNKFSPNLAGEKRYRLFLLLYVVLNVPCKYFLFLLSLHNNIIVLYLPLAFNVFLRVIYEETVLGCDVIKGINQLSLYEEYQIYLEHSNHDKVLTFFILIES